MPKKRNGKLTEETLTQIGRWVAEPDLRSSAWHPSVEQLEGWEQGVLPDQLSQFIDEHIWNCQECQELIATAGELSAGDTTSPPDSEATIPSLPNKPNWQWRSVAGAHVQLEQTGTGWFAACPELDIAVEATDQDAALIALGQAVKDHCEELNTYGGEVGGRIATQKRFLLSLGGPLAWADRFVRQLSGAAEAPPGPVRHAVEVALSVTARGIRYLLATPEIATLTPAYATARNKDSRGDKVADWVLLSTEAGGLKARCRIYGSRNDRFVLALSIVDADADCPVGGAQVKLFKGQSARDSGMTDISGQWSSGPWGADGKWSVSVAAVEQEIEFIMDFRPAEGLN